MKKSFVWENPQGCDEETEFTYHEDGSLFVEIDEPWQGDTESGFGIRSSITIAPDAAAELIEMLWSAHNARISGTSGEHATSNDAEPAVKTTDERS